MANSNRSVMTHQFSQVPAAEIQRSSFDRSHGIKTTFNAGQLIPIFVDEALPGDTFNLKMQGFARLATPIFPVMDNMRMETFFFAVPIRLLWDNWEKFNGAQDRPGDSTDFLVPQVTSPAGGYLENSLQDHLGLPIGVDITHNVLHERAYNKIFDDWFRDQNHNNSLDPSTGDGPDNSADYILVRRNKRHDYFISCLPWPQKGDPISIPLGEEAPVISDAFSSVPKSGQPLWNVDGVSTGIQLESGNLTNVEWQQVGGTPGADAFWDEPALIADLTTATAATINTIRQGFQIQRMLERDARGGTRYTEIIRAHFGVTSPDARLQRAEYLGGGSTPVIVSPVAQTSATDPAGPDASPQGNLAAFGTANLRNHGFTKSFTEHCVLLGMVCVTADLTYQQGINRMFSRRTRFDYYWPALANIGEQTVLNKEIFATGTAPDEDVFGYQERYAEYRYKPSEIHGLFRSQAPESLDAWHLSQDFEELPELGPAFIREQPPVDRVIAVPDEPHFLFDSYFSMRCARPMPLYGVPGLIDHF